MAYFMQILIFGLLAFLMFIFSIDYARKKQTKAGMLCGWLELLSATIATAAWMEALRASGKTDWFLLGFFSYRLAALIFISMFVVGIGCIVVNLWMCYKRSTATTHAVQA